jgi:hypothetical protein
MTTSVLGRSPLGIWLREIMLIKFILFETEETELNKTEHYRKNKQNHKNHNK